MSVNQTQSGSSMQAIFNRAANNGLYLGVYLSILALSLGFGQSSVLAGYVMLIGSLYLPFFAYRLLRTSYAKMEFNSPLSELWSEGCISFSLASLIQAAVIYVGLLFIAPNFIADTVATSIDVFTQQPGEAAEQWKNMLELSIEQYGLPTATDVVVQTISMNMFGGVIISLICSAILKSRYASAERCENYRNRHSK